MWRLQWLAERAKKERVAGIGSFPRTVRLWEGPSLLEPSVEIMVAAACAGVAPSANRKTGDMVQVAIYRKDMTPMQAWKEGRETAVCPTDCLHRSKASGGDGSCYVNKGRLNSSWHAAKRAPLIEDLRSFGRGAKIRLGREADPAAVPLHVWRELLAEAKGWTAYTAGWRSLDAEWADFVMASCSSPSDAKEAMDRGWRVFASSDSLAADDAYESMGIRKCLHDSHLLTCARCQGCDGKMKGARRAGFYTPLHGPVGKWIRVRNNKE